MVDGVSSSQAGLAKAAQRAQVAAERIAKSRDADIAEESVKVKEAATEYRANAKALKAQLDTEKRALDILA
jgi:hypothetical protein